jgi:type 1 fimbriae regulatory protein FimB
MVERMAVAKVVEFKPCRKPAPQTPRTSRHGNRMVALEPSELIRLLEVARKHSVRDWAMLLVGYCHGLRATEICNLKLSDVDLRAGSIRCRRLKGSLESVQALSPHRGNPLLDEIKALKAWLKVRKDDGSGYLFLSSKGGAISRVQFFRLFRRYSEAAGLPPAKRHPHCLKHSMVSHMIEADQNLAKVQLAAGHRSIASTMRYVSISGQQADVARQQTFMRIFSGAR